MTYFHGYTMKIVTTRVLDQYEYNNVSQIVLETKKKCK